MTNTDECPKASLMYSVDAPLSLLMVDQEWRLTYPVTFSVIPTADAIRRYQIITYTNPAMWSMTWFGVQTAQNPNDAWIIQEIISEIVFKTYNILEDDIRFRKSICSFEQQREQYPPRREYGAYTINIFNDQVGAQSVSVKYRTRRSSPLT